MGVWGVSEKIRGKVKRKCREKSVEAWEEKNEKSTKKA